MTMIDPAGLPRSSPPVRCYPDRHAEDRAFRPPPEIGLHEDADRVALAAGDFDHSRRGAVATLEIVAQHAGTAADAALLERAAARRIQRLNHMLRLHVKAVDVVEIAVIGLGSDRQAPIGHDAGLDQPLDRRIARKPAGMRVGDGDRRVQFATLLEPDRARHLAIAVERIISGGTGDVQRAHVRAAESPSRRCARGLSRRPAFLRRR